MTILIQCLNNQRRQNRDEFWPIPVQKGSPSSQKMSYFITFPTNKRKFYIIKTFNKIQNILHHRLNTPMRRYRLISQGLNNIPCISFYHNILKICIYCSLNGQQGCIASPVTELPGHRCSTRVATRLPSWSLPTTATEVFPSQLQHQNSILSNLVEVGSKFCP